MTEILAGRYELSDLIGRGGMAQVYRATDTTLGRTVAVKVLSAQFAADPSFVERFRREAQAAARLNNPNVVNVYDSGTEGSTHYIVMEYVEGRTLAEVLAQDGRLLPERATEIAGSVCQALAFAHAAGIVHRDVKPGNIMVTNAGQVKLMDFGIARADTQETAAQTAAVLGTAAYLSPEQAQGAPMDTRTDIYSLGVVLYEMLAGRPPFTGDTAVAVAMQHVNDQPVPPSQLVNGITPDLDAVVMRALSKNPDNRYADVQAFEQDLDRVRAGQRVAAPPVMAAPTAVMTPTQVGDQLSGPPASDSSKTWAWVIGIAIALGVLLLLWLLFFRDGTPEPGVSPSPGAGTVTVPNVVELSRREAEDALRQANLRPEREDEITDDPNEVGFVLEQVPGEGKEVPENSTVVLTIGKAAASPTPGSTSVPTVYNLSRSDAERAITEAGLVVGRTTKSSSNAVPRGNVYKQSPSAGTKVPEQSTVDIWVSTGPPEPEQVEIPDYTCESVGKASNKLSQLDLNVVTGSDDPNPSCPQSSKVGSLNPGPGTLVAPGSTVTIHPSGP